MRRYTLFQSASLYAPLASLGRGQVGKVDDIVFDLGIGTLVALHQLAEDGRQAKDLRQGAQQGRFLQCLCLSNIGEHEKYVVKASFPRLQ